MGYTHYWRRPRLINEKIYGRIIDDFGKTLPELAKHIDLADSDGEGMPWIDKNTGQVHFNGREACGHDRYELGIAWLTENAGGVAGPNEKTAKGRWGAGALIEQRQCSGDCSHENFIFDRDRGKPEDWEKPKEGLYFDFCKTAFKPYDLAVITFLIIAKHYLDYALKVSSEGTNQQWFDGKMLCQIVLGYGLEYQIDKEGELSRRVEVR